MRVVYNLNKKAYSIKTKSIELLVTEYYGVISKKTPTKITITFEDVNISHDDSADIISGESLSQLFVDAMITFLKKTK